MGRGGQAVTADMPKKESSWVPFLAGSCLLAVTLISEPLAIKAGVLPDDVDGIFSRGVDNDNRWAMYVYIAYEIGRACLAHGAAYVFLTGLQSTWPLLKDPSARSILARSVMNLSFLGACGWRGLRMWQDIATEPFTLPQFIDALGSSKKVLSFVPSTPKGRLYDHYPGFQRLSAVMAAFQFKNLADTVYYNDGFVFVVHHILTVIVASNALAPFAHFHGTFFFGVSETSTTLLAFLANFDKDHGIKALEQNYPGTRKVAGGVFAVSFLVVRGILWPFFSYFFIQDALAVLRNDDAHNVSVVYGFVATLATLSLMQLLWLGQIALVVYDELFKPLLSADTNPKKVN